MLFIYYSKCEAQCNLHCVLPLWIFRQTPNGTKRHLLKRWPSYINKERRAIIPVQLSMTCLQLLLQISLVFLLIFKSFLLYGNILSFLLWKLFLLKKEDWVWLPFPWWMQSPHYDTDTAFFYFYFFIGGDGTAAIIWWPMRRTNDFHSDQPPK